MGQFFDGWIASESQDHDAIKVKRLYVDINEGNWYDAALFSQIMYWHGNSRETGKRRLQIERDGFFWLAKRYDDWWRECRVTAETAKKAITRMVKRGLLIKKVWLFDGKPTVHIRVNIEGFELLANHCIAENKELAEEFELNRSNVPNGKGTIDQMEKVQRTDSITETTTQTTAVVENARAPIDEFQSTGQPAKVYNFDELYKPFNPAMNDTIAFMEAQKYMRAYEDAFPANAPIRLPNSNTNRETALFLLAAKYKPEDVTELVKQKIAEGKAYKFPWLQTDMSEFMQAREKKNAPPQKLTYIVAPPPDDDDYVTETKSA